MKSKRTIVGLKEKFPVGSEIFLNENSAYINSDIFFSIFKKLVDYFYISKES